MQGRDHPFEVYELPDSSRLMLLPIQKATTFAVYVCVHYGSLHVKTEKDYEAAHFFEHLFHSLPSRKYPNSRENEQVFAQMGIDTNATTYEYKTIYHYRGLVKYLNKVLEMLLAAYERLKIDKSVFEQEKSAVMNELKRDMSDPSEIFEDKLVGHLFQNNKLIQHMSLGNRYKRSKKLTSGRLKGLWKQHYRGSPVLFFVGGGCDSRAVLRFFKTRVPSLPRTGGQLPFIKFCLTNTETIVPIPLLQSTRISVGWSVPFGWTDQKKRVELIVINDVLNHSISGRLYRELRSKHGYIYWVRGELIKNEDNGMVYIVSTEVENQSIVRDTLNIILRETEAIYPVTRKELDSSKAGLTFDLEHGLTRRMDPSYWFYEYHEDVFFKNPLLTRAKKCEILDLITARDFLHTAKLVFRSDKRFVFLGVPPVKKDICLSTRIENCS